MTFNWGTGITAAIVLFMSFILFLVFKTTQTHSDLYAADYYQQELRYQENIEAKSNAAQLTGNISISQDRKAVRLEYPETIGQQNPVGTIHFFRPDNAKLDLNMPLHAEAGEQVIAKDQLVRGRYTVRISWEMGEKPYLHEETLYVL